MTDKIPKAGKTDKKTEPQQIDDAKLDRAAGGAEAKRPGGANFVFVDGAVKFSDGTSNIKT